jgi:hypothetical protein
MSRVELNGLNLILWALRCPAWHDVAVVVDGQESRRIVGDVCAELDYLTSQAAEHNDTEAFDRLVDAIRDGRDTKASVDSLVELARRWGVPLSTSAKRSGAPPIVVKDHPDDEVWVCPAKPWTCRRIEPIGQEENAPTCSLHSQQLRRLRVG